MNNDEIKKWFYKCVGDLHFYNSPSEELIKVVVWWVSWLGSVCAIDKSTDERAIASAFLIFSASLLMDIVFRIGERKTIVVKMLSLLMCVGVLYVLLNSISVLMMVAEAGTWAINKFLLLLPIIVFCLDYVLWIFFKGEKVEDDDNKVNSLTQIGEKRQELFINKMVNGQIGSIPVDRIKEEIDDNE